MSGSLSGPYVVYATRHLGLAPATLGLVFAVGNVGFAVGAVVADRAVARLGVGRAIVGSSLLSGPALVLISRRRSASSPRSGSARWARRRRLPPGARVADPVARGGASA
jgi:MFS family permease